MIVLFSHRNKVGVQPFPGIFLIFFGPKTDACYVNGVVFKRCVVTREKC